jgi:hypothetical protein
MILNDPRRLIFLAALTAALAVVTSPALAVHDKGLFELEGNADAEADPGDDWENLFSGGTTIPLDFITSTDVPIADPAPQSIFTGGGSKDIRDVSQWKHKDGSVPAKDDLTNAYAAAYRDPADGHLIFYFGADRFANNGDAQMGFWFFQNEVGLIGDGTSGGGDPFFGTHKNDDILVLVNFIGGGGTPVIEVFAWDDSVKDNLVQVVSPTSAKCGTTANDDVCAITNDITAENSPWAYIPKSGPINIFPEDSFFEGGIDVTALFPDTACFSAFLAETRSSQSANAQLKDFVVGEFRVCKVELSKVCETGVVDLALDAIVADFTVTAKNEGFATVQSVVATDNNCTPPDLPGTGADDFTLNLGPIDANQSDSADGQCVVPASQFDPGVPLLNRVSAVADGGEVPVVLAPLGVGPGKCLAHEDNDGDGVDETCVVECPVDLSRDIRVTKRCVTRLAVENEMVKVRVNFAGDVCNIGSGPTAEPLTNVSVSDDKAGGPLELFDDQGGSLGTSTRLDPGECAFFKDSYDPTSVNSLCPEEAVFMDTVIGEGEGLFTGATVMDSDTATCFLCPGECEDL